MGWGHGNQYPSKEFNSPILMHLQTGRFPKKAFRNAAVSRPTAANAKCQVPLLHVCLPPHPQPCAPQPSSSSFMSDIWQRNPLGAERVLPPRETVVNLNIVLGMRERERERDEGRERISRHINFAAPIFPRDDLRA